MEREEFANILLNEGFAEGIVVDKESNGFLDSHVHPFEAKALILSGELSLRVGDTEQLYQPGQVFHLPANTLHSERYGSVGVSYLVGRK
ncbi:cupin [Glaciimonas sp. PCH181]|nr:cupin domain-containing protein [Glaciimonas sp. PCH181]PUA17003.1 cupin [Glaciimonas sp. PCH181]